MKGMSANNFIATLEDQTLIRVSGIDAQNFLQGQMTCDMREITPQQSRLGAICNIQGRVIATFRVFLYQENYYLSLPASMAALILQHLKKYGAFSKVKIEEAKTDFLHFGIVGDAIKKIEQTLSQTAPQKIDVALTTNDCIIIRIPGETPRWEVFTKKMDSRFRENDNYEFEKDNNPDAWKLLDLQAGIPTVYPETSGMFTPQMINYPELNGVSFNKGCYLGQEIIARTHYLGKTKRKMLILTFTSEITPKEGNKILNENKEEVGTIVNFVLIQNNSYTILIVTNQNNITPSQNLKISQ